MTDNTQLFNRAPRWQKRKSGLRQLPDALQSWLLETGSLTQRLRSLYGQELAVKLLSNHWAPAFIDESRLLEQAAWRYQLVREVVLHANEQPLILARTILPATTIKIAQRHLSHLGNRPLGEVIFAYHDLQRRQRQFSHIPSKDWSTSLQRAIPIDQDIWGRRTVYAIHNQPLLVAEFFLPACWLM